MILKLRIRRSTARRELGVRSPNGVWRIARCGQRLRAATRRRGQGQAAPNAQGDILLKREPANANSQNGACCVRRRTRNKQFLIDLITEILYLAPFN